jgi:hypothetical protein
MAAGREDDSGTKEGTMGMIRSLRRAMGVLALMAVPALTDPLAGQDARVLGRVTDGVGNPVPGAQVTLVAHEGGAAQQAVAGTSGGFEFTGVEPGIYTLRAVRQGHPAFERRIVVRRGQVVSQVLRMRTPGGRSATSAASRPGG